MERNIPDNISDYELDSQFGSDYDEELEMLEEEEDEEPDLTIDDLEVEDLEEIGEDKIHYE